MPDKVSVDKKPQETQKAVVEAVKHTPSKTNKQLPWIIGGSVLLLLLLVSGWYMFNRGPGSTSLTKQLEQVISPAQDPTVVLKSDYQNPFDANAQYVNPFSEYHNPFDSLE